MLKRTQAAETKVGEYLEEAVAAKKAMQWQMVIHEDIVNALIEYIPKTTRQQIIDIFEFCDSNVTKFLGGTLTP